MSPMPEGWIRLQRNLVAYSKMIVFSVSINLTAGPHHYFSICSSWQQGKVLIRKQKWVKKHMGYKAVAAQRLGLLIFSFNKSSLLRIRIQAHYGSENKNTSCFFSPKKPPKTKTTTTKKGNVNVEWKKIKACIIFTVKIYRGDKKLK